MTTMTMYHDYHHFRNLFLWLLPNTGTGAPGDGSVVLPLDVEGKAVAERPLAQLEGVEAPVLDPASTYTTTFACVLVVLPCTTTTDNGCLISSNSNVSSSGGSRSNSSSSESGHCLNTMQQWQWEQQQ